MTRPVAATAFVAALLLGGCVTQPEGPTIPVMPGRDKSFTEFQNDDMQCQSFASNRVAGRAENANDRAILSAIIGAGVGAALGGAVGGGEGAGVGAASGGIVGGAIGSNQSAYAQGTLQRRYNIAYAQCMEAKGNDVRGGPPPYGSDWHRYDDRYGPPPPPPDY